MRSTAKTMRLKVEALEPRLVLNGGGVPALTEQVEALVEQVENLEVLVGDGNTALEDSIDVLAEELTGLGVVIETHLEADAAQHDALQASIDALAADIAALNAQHEVVESEPARVEGTWHKVKRAVFVFKTDDGQVLAKVRGVKRAGATRIWRFTVFVPQTRSALTFDDDKLIGKAQSKLQAFHKAEVWVDRLYN